MIVCGLEDVREHKPAVSKKTPVHPVHRCESKIYPCLTMNRFPATRCRGLFQVSRPPPCRADHSRKNSRSLMKTNHEWTRINTNRPEDRWTSFNHKRHQNASTLLSRWCDHVMGGSPPGARASRPHKSSRSFSHLLHRNQPAAAPCLCFGRAHAVPADRAVGCNIAGKLSGNRRDSMRAGRPRSRGCRPDGEVGGIRRATSLKAGLSPLGNSRLPASRAPAPRDWADPSRRTIN